MNPFLRRSTALLVTAMAWGQAIPLAAAQAPPAEPPPPPPALPAAGPPASPEAARSAPSASSASPALPPPPPLPPASEGDDEPRGARQAENRGDARARQRPWLGGLGFASAALFFGDMSALSSALAKPGAIGPSYDVAPAGVLVGGGGGALLFGHVWLGGKGFGLITSSSSAPNASTQRSSGGGGVELGYVIHPMQRALLIPFFGVGGFGYTVEVTNNSAAPIVIQSDLSIEPGQTKAFEAGFMTVDAGVRFQRLMFGRGGGFAAGFEVGVLASYQPGRWRDGAKELLENESARLSGGYVRFVLGGGGFMYR
jgi:hypothetical protein